MPNKFCLGVGENIFGGVNLFLGRGKKISGKKTENDLHAMKQILYDMGPLTLVRWPL